MTGELFNSEAFEQMPGQMSMQDVAENPKSWDGEPMFSADSVKEADAAVRAFNVEVASWTTPEARERRAQERAEYEAQYEAMTARKRTERFNAQFDDVLSTYFAPYWEDES